MTYDRTKLGALFYDITMKAGRFLIRHPIIAQILGLTWGFLGVLVGLIEMLMVLILPKKKIFGVFNNFPYVMFGDNWGGLEGYLWFFLAGNMGEEWALHIKRHEVGHCFQNAIFGPFTLFIVFIPSIIRYWLRPKGTPYDRIWFEGSATDLGTEYDEYFNLTKKSAE